MNFVTNGSFSEKLSAHLIKCSPFVRWRAELRENRCVAKVGRSSNRSAHQDKHMPRYSVILLVEDNPDDVELIRKACEQSGIARVIHVVQHGAQAMDYFCGAGVYADRKQYPLPSLVLLDLTLPLVSGLDVLEWIRKQPGLQLLRVVILTASKDAADRERAYALKANSYLNKPSSFERLVGLMNDLISVGP